MYRCRIRAQMKKNPIPVQIEESHSSANGIGPVGRLVMGHGFPMRQSHGTGYGMGRDGIGQYSCPIMGH